MSKVGKKPIPIPENVTVKIEKNRLQISGPKGELGHKVSLGLKVEIKDNQIIIEAKNETKQLKSLHGLHRTLVANKIEGVVNGFSKTLELHGTGYRVSLEKDSLKMQLGFSHPVVVKPVEGIEFQVEGNNVIKVSGLDKQLVGQVTASIRDLRKPDAYKGKGIRYLGEVVKLKPGKAAKIGVAAEA